MTKGRLADLFYETETEYFGLPPFGLLDEIGETIVNEVLQMFERCPKSIQSQIDFLSEAQVETGCENWAQAVEQSISRTFELFETYCLKNVLAIPESFVLPHRPAKDLFAHDHSKIDEELGLLMNQYQTEMTKQHELKLQQARLAAEEEALTRLENQIEALNNILATHSIADLSGSLCSLGNQMDTLKALVADTLEASSNAFAFDDGELPHRDNSGLTAMELDSGDYPADCSMAARLLGVEMKQCAVIASLADIKAFLG